MKRSTKDQAGGLLHQVKGGLKEIAGQVGKNSELEAEGKNEKRDGKL